jgi:predicted DNA-binding antitoxin AbrB/MazE fold protein
MRHGKRKTAAPRMAYTEEREDTAMTTTIDVVYEDGTFRPVEPVSVPEGTRARVTMPLTETREPAKDDLANGKTPYEMLMEIASLPGPAQTDTFSGADHDTVLYGENGAP